MRQLWSDPEAVPALTSRADSTRVCDTPPVSEPARVRLITKPGCHLCDDARAVIEHVCAEASVAWDEVSIEDDPALADLHWEQIPVVLLDGRPFDFWRVDPARLRDALDR